MTGSGRSPELGLGGGKGNATRREFLATAAAGLAAAAPAGQLTWGVHISLAPTWFDPAETPGIITPFHDHVRAARRHGEADAGAAACVEPRGIVVGVGG